MVLQGLGSSLIYLEFLLQGSHLKHPVHRAPGNHRGHEWAQNPTQQDPKPASQRTPHLSLELLTDDGILADVLIQADHVALQLRWGTEKKPV